MKPSKTFETYRGLRWCKGSAKTAVDIQLAFVDVIGRFHFGKCLKLTMKMCQDIEIV